MHRAARERTRALMRFGRWSALAALQAAPESRTRWLTLFFSGEFFMSSIPSALPVAPSKT